MCNLDFWCIENYPLFRLNLSLVCTGRSQLAALIKTQKQQFRLEKALTQQQRDIRYLQQAHDLTKSGMTQ